MKLKMTACIEAPKEKVWNILSDVQNINLWVESIQSAICETEKTRGVGTIRICHLQGDMTIREKWVEWDEGRSFTYEADASFAFKWAKNRWSVYSVNGKTLLTTESEIIPRGGIFGKLLVPLIYIASKKMGRDSLTALKYLIEVGQPYTGKISNLPSIAKLC